MGIHRFYNIFLFLTLFSLCACTGSIGTNPWESSQAQQAPSELNRNTSPSSEDYYYSSLPSQERQTGPESYSDARRLNNNTIENAAEPGSYESIPTAKVAILLPLSGPNAPIGQSMLQAAQLALFDMGYANFELITKDTKGTPQGASAAASSAISEGAQLILGPLLSSSVSAAKNVTARRNVNMIAFTTDWAHAGGNTFVMGFVPFAQVQRITNYVAREGYETAAIMAPNDKYGNTVSRVFEQNAQNNGLRITERFRFSPQNKNLTNDLKPHTNYDARKNTLNATIAQLEAQLKTSPDDPQVREELEKLKRMDTYGKPPFQAVFMPVTGTQLELLATGLSYYGLHDNQVRRIGTGLWDDPKVARMEHMNGAWFAAPSPRLRQGFESRYQDTYGQRPPRLASLAYDGTALAAVLARTGYQRSGKPAFDRAALTNPNGFNGMDGIFRFNPNGLVERGLAVLEIRNGEIREIDPAPKTFQALEY